MSISTINIIILFKYINNDTLDVELDKPILILAYHTGLSFKNTEINFGKLVIMEMLKYGKRLGELFMLHHKNKQYQF